MAITHDEAVELAGLLSDDLRCDNARQRLLCVLQLVQDLTDSEHVLSNADIRAILAARFGDDVAPSENTIAADLRAIASAGIGDLALHTTPSGVWAEHLRLTPAKVRLMLNSVQASRFLTVEQSAELQEDLFALVSRHQEDDLAGQVYVDQRVRKSYQQVFDVVDAAERAIHLGKKLEFCYTFSNFAGKSRTLPGDNGSDLRVETPIAVYFSENNYYVETYTTTPWRHGLNLTLSRADRMVDVRVSNEPADSGRVVYDLRRSIKRRMEENFDMVGGPKRHLFLRVRSDATNVLYDRFGFGFKFAQFEGKLGEPSTTALTLITVPQSLTFFRWLSSVGASIVIVDPPSEMVIASSPWKRVLKDVPHSQLVEDYRETVAGFLAFLDRSRSAYES